MTKRNPDEQLTKEKVEGEIGFKVRYNLKIIDRLSYITY